MGGECFGKSEEDGQSSQLCPEEHGRDVLLPGLTQGELHGAFMVFHRKIFLEM